MESIIYSVAHFTVEFIKLYLGNAIFFRVKLKKSIFLLYFCSIPLISMISLQVDMNRYGIIYVYFIIAIFVLSLEKLKKWWVLPVLYVIICVTDVVNSLLVVRLFDLTMEEYNQNPWISLGIDSIVLWLLLGIALVLKKIKLRLPQVQMPKYSWLYVLGACTVSIYLTCMVMNELNGKESTFQNELSWALSLSGIVFVAICILLLIKYNQNESLVKEKEVSRQLLDVQQQYCQLLLEKEKQTRSFRHDINNHIYCLQSLVQQGDYGEVKKYLETMREEVSLLSPKIQTGNTLMTAIMTEVLEKFPNVQCQWKGMLTENMNVSAYDICTIFFNLFINAFEAADKTKEKEVSVDVRFMRDTLVLRIVNTFSQMPVLENGNYISTKQERGHGFGIKNARDSIAKNGGNYQASIEGERFVTEVILPKVLT